MPNRTPTTGTLHSVIIDSDRAIISVVLDYHPPKGTWITRHYQVVQSTGIAMASLIGHPIKLDVTPLRDNQSTDGIHGLRLSGNATG